MNLPIDIWKYIAIFTNKNCILVLINLSKLHYKELSKNSYLEFLLKSRYPILDIDFSGENLLNYIKNLNSLEKTYLQNITPIYKELNIKILSLKYYSNLVHNSTEQEKKHNWVVISTVNLRNNLKKQIGNLQKIRDILKTDFSQECLNLFNLFYLG